jgi:hypothetical protein
MSSTDIVNADLPFAGLGNMLLVWARAAIFAELNHLPMVAPMWNSISALGCEKSDASVIMAISSPPATILHCGNILLEKVLKKVRSMPIHRSLNSILGLRKYLNISEISFYSIECLRGMTIFKISRIIKY